MKKFLTVETVIEKFNEMNNHISMEKTGDPIDFAKLLKLGLPKFNKHMASNRVLLRRFGIEIICDRKRKTYRFSKQGKLKIEITMKWTDAPE